MTHELAPNVLGSWATETPDGVTSSRAGGSELRVAMSSDGTSSRHSDDGRRSARIAPEAVIRRRGGHYAVTAGVAG